jgi:alkanesulfonate monooxygenase
VSAIHLHWFLPAQGDGFSIGSTGEDRGSTSQPRSVTRAPTLDYLELVTRAAEQAGFESLLTPTGTWCDEAWILSSFLAARTNRIAFLVAFRPGTISPFTAAAQASTFVRHAPGRVAVNIVTGGDPVELRRTGDRLGKEDRYRRTEEFLEAFSAVYRTAISGAPGSFSGEYFQIDDAVLPGVDGPRPPIFLGGASDQAKRVAARVADVHLTWGEQPEAVAEHVVQLGRYADAVGRDVQAGIRLHVISRATSEEAWARAGTLVDELSPARVAQVQKVLATHESEGQRRMAALHQRALESLEISPNLWAGFGLVRGGAGAALVGSHREVADRILEYHGLGVSHFILSGQPHAEEALNFGENVAPLIREQSQKAAAVAPVSRRS